MFETELNDDLSNIDEVRREKDMVSQSLNLFPHMTVLDKCALAPMLVRKMSEKDAE